MKELQEHVANLIDLAVQIQQIPAPTFHEARRANFIFNLFKKAGLSNIETDPQGNVFGRVETTGPWKSKAPIVVSAHLDTVFPLESDLKVTQEPQRVHGPGIGDNSLGVACLAVLPEILRDRQIDLERDLWLVANTGEEGMGNLEGMKAVCSRFKSEPKAYIILEGIGLGDIFHRGLAVSRYRITVDTPGGHSWSDYGSPSAIHELARLVSAFTSLNLPANPRTSLNVGVISGGTSINTIASNAWLELDLRSEQAISLRKLVSEIEDLVVKANQTNVTVHASQVGKRPAGSLPANHWLVQLASECLMDHGIKPVLRIGSTDANYPLSQGFTAICLGLTTGGRAHSRDEFIHIPPLSQGIEALVQLICAIK